MLAMSLFDDVVHPFLSLDPDTARRRFADPGNGDERRHIRLSVLRTMLFLATLFGGLAAVGTALPSAPHANNALVAPG